MGAATFVRNDKCRMHVNDWSTEVNRMTHDQTQTEVLVLNPHLAASLNKSQNEVQHY